jgi:hypothetical protein
MTSAAAKATFERPGSAAADRAWLAAKAEHERMTAIARGPGAAAEEARAAEARTAAAELERERIAAVSRTGANWVRTGRGAGWLTPAR